MRKYVLILISLLLITTNISAATSVRDSIQLVYPITGMIPIVSSITVYLLLTVLYLYILLMYEVDPKKALVIATIIWLVSLGIISHLFNNLIATEAAVIVSIISYAIITFKSLYKNAQS